MRRTLLVCICLIPVSGCAPVREKESEELPSEYLVAEVMPADDPALEGVGDQGQPARDLPPEVVAAWVAAGAKVGWMVPSQRYLQFAEKREDLPAMAVPAFWIQDYHEGMLARLPTPAQAFGLSLTDGKNPYRRWHPRERPSMRELDEWQVTDASMKDIASLKQLTALNLLGTKITDARLKELVSLKRLTSLDLSSTFVTDAGLKDQAPLVRLPWLGLALPPTAPTGIENRCRCSRPNAPNALSVSSTS